LYEEVTSQMELSRRDFLKLSGVTVGGLLLGGKPTGIGLAQGIQPFPLHKPVGETPTICCFCAVGCGAIVAAQDGRVVNLEGDPDHPINQGSLCTKGLALAQLNTVDGRPNPRRLQKVKYRARGSSAWEERDWSWAIEQIARRIKDTRDEYLIQTDGEGRAVNRLEAIASLGGAALDNEECSLIVKAMRALGLVYIEHQARI
jgi:formate dehydrogenase major subunit